MKMTWWLEPEKRYEAQEGHSDAYREGYLAVIDKCVEYCHIVLDGDMYSLRLKTLQDLLGEDSPPLVGGEESPF